MAASQYFLTLRLGVAGLMCEVGMQGTQSISEHWGAKALIEMHLQPQCAIGQNDPMRDLSDRSLAFGSVDSGFESTCANRYQHLPLPLPSRGRILILNYRESFRPSFGSRMI